MNRAEGLATPPGLGGAHSLFASPELNVELFVLRTRKSNAIPTFLGEKSHKPLVLSFPKRGLQRGENPNPSKQPTPLTSTVHQHSIWGEPLPLKTCIRHGFCLQRTDPEGPQPPPWWHHVPGTCSMGAGELQLCRPSRLLPMLLAQGIAQMHFKEAALQQECLKKCISICHSHSTCCGALLMTICLSLLLPGA